MKTNRWVRVIIVIVFVALLIAAAAPHAAPPIAFAASGSEGAAAETRRPEAQAGDAPEGFTADDWATMQDLMREAQYQFTWQVSDGAWAYHAPNRAHDLWLSLAADGLTATRYGDEGKSLWNLHLSLVAYGGQTFPAAIARSGLRASRERVEYHWSRNVVEWYVNSAHGVEHGLTLTAPPAGADGPTVELTFALRGSLTPQLDGSGQALRLKDGGGRTVLRYDHLAVYDAAGRSLPAYFSLSSEGEGESLRIAIETTNAAYPLTVDPLLHDQAAKLTASDAEDDDYFGGSVAISGATVVVGAAGEDGAGSNRGAAYVFERNQDGADSWGQVQKLTASDAQNDDHFGWSVSISGDTIAVGAEGEDGTGSQRGAAYVYERNQGGPDTWGQVQKLTASDTQNDDYFGRSVSISGDTIVVGADLEDGAGSDRGAAYVFARNQGGADSWGQVQKLTASDAGDDDYFGWSVSISGDTVAVGAFGEDGTGSDRGAAYVFERNQDGADSWGQVQKLTASDAQNGDNFGRSAAISGDTVVVGAYGKDGARGAAYVYERNQGGPDTWGQVQKLTASDGANGDLFGNSVSISGDTVVVGAYGEDGTGSARGAAYVFAAEDGRWGEVAIPHASDGANGDRFGWSVAISGDTVVVGAHEEDDAGYNSGAAYVFARNQGGADSWGQVQKLTASDGASGDHFGYSVAISGDTIVVGADGEDGAGSYRGAAYVFERNQDGADSWGEVQKLTASDAENHDYFGWSVSISGDTVVVGAYGEDGAGITRGAAYVFARNQDGVDSWGQVQKLTASDGADHDVFGKSVAISGDTVVVGADGKDGARGAAYVFARNQDGVDSWGQVQKLTASDAADGDHFGEAVAIGGDTVVVGAYGEDGAGNTRGAAYVFERNQDGADSWGQVQKLTASDAADGDRFGETVAISGDTVVVGTPEEDGAGSYRGAAYVFERNQDGVDSWGQVTKLTASNAADGDRFGNSVAISGDTVVVGAYGKDVARGATYVFGLQEMYNIYLPLVVKE